MTTTEISAIKAEMDTKLRAQIRRQQKVVVDAARGLQNLQKDVAAAAEFSAHTICSDVEERR